MRVFFVIYLLVSISCFGQAILKIDTKSEWEKITLNIEHCEIKKADDIGGIVDLMGNGSLLLKKNNPKTNFARNEEFNSEGYWESNWIELDSNFAIQSLETNMLIYGEQIDMTNGWKKFDYNPLISGSNTLLPLNEDNITSETILLPDPPGGVPQDQAIFLGRGKWHDKWILMFNHTPNAWPNDYYWSYAVADSLAPIKRGKNPFQFEIKNYPLFGPINNQAPNDWLEVNGVYYAPDETYQSVSHLWKSEDMINWVDLGVIENKVGTDPGIIFDGDRFHLFSENGNTISHCYLDIDSLKGSENKDVLNVGDHTGDADVAFFNNQWHMFVDDGIHLKYKISYASTSPDSFPYGWKLFPEIYGPHKPEEGQIWDDDNEDGNRFGTGDADIALEGNTLYLFTERPIGVAYKELTELFNDDDQNVEVLIEVDNNEDGIKDDSTDWKELRAGKSIWNFAKPIVGNKIKIRYRINSAKSNESPLIKSFKLFSNLSSPYKLELESSKNKLLTFSDSSLSILVKVKDRSNRLCVSANNEVNIKIDGPGSNSNSNMFFTKNGIGSFDYIPTNSVEEVKIIAESEGLISDTLKLELSNIILIDDFENYLYESHFYDNWFPYSGLEASVSLDNTNYGNGESSLKYKYNIGNGDPPFSGIYKNINVGDVEVNSLNFWIKPDGSKRELNIRLSESSSNYWEYSVNMNDTLKPNIKVYLAEFHSNSNESEINLNFINSISFFVLPGDGIFGSDSIWIDNIYFDPKTNVTEVGKENPISHKTVLINHNFPNPFNPTTSISFFLNKKSHVSLSIYNILGEKIDELVNADLNSGYHNIEWNATNFSSGIYLYQIKTANSIQTKKCLLLK